MINPDQIGSQIGRLAIRPIGLADLVEQIFTGLKPNSSYTLALTRSKGVPYNLDYEINTFTTDAMGKYAGQSTGLIKTINSSGGTRDYSHVVLIDPATRETVLIY
jgi:hypothetical protein